MLPGALSNGSEEWASPKGNSSSRALLSASGMNASSNVMSAGIVNASSNVISVTQAWARCHRAGLQFEQVLLCIKIGIK